MPRVILVASSCSTLPVGQRRTGVSLQQLGSAHESFIEAGWDVQLASPAGGVVPVDAGSLSEEWIRAASLAEDSACLDDLVASDADAWFVLGGHGALGDLTENAQLRSLLAGALTSGSLVAAVDHGCAALSGIADRNGVRALAGRAATGRTDFEEREIHHLTMISTTTEQLLRASGARFTSRNPWEPYVVVDANVVTGQNPASTEQVVSAVLDLYDGFPLAA